MTEVHVSSHDLYTDFWFQSHITVACKPEDHDSSPDLLFLRTLWAPIEFTMHLPLSVQGLALCVKKIGSSMSLVLLREPKPKCPCILRTEIAKHHKETLIRELSDIHLLFIYTLQVNSYHNFYEPRNQPTRQLNLCIPYNPPLPFALDCSGLSESPSSNWQTLSCHLKNPVVTGEISIFESDKLIQIFPGLLSSLHF